MWLLHREGGATKVEYGLMAALIAMVCIAAVTLVGRSTSTTFGSATTNLSNAGQSSSQGGGASGDSGHSDGESGDSGHSGGKWGNSD